METPVVINYHLDPFWDDEYKKLNYIQEPFNDPCSVGVWIEQGYHSNFTGEMCDMRSPQPRWNQKFINIYHEMGWQDIGTSYYRMDTGTVLPSHSDLYLRYIDLFNLKGREHTIRLSLIHI